METSNFRFNLAPSGDMIFGKTINSILQDIDEKLFDALYGDHTAFYGAAAAVADPGPGATGPVTLTPVPEAIFAHEVTLKKLRVVIPIAGNTVAGPGLVLNVARVSDGLPVLTPIPVPAGAALDRVYDFPDGEDLADDDELQVTIANITAPPAPVAGSFNLQVVLAADIKFPEE